ncbi:MAG: hypothetical protein RLZZ301_486 [Bacteroidota bacterium]|jgi:nitroreductase
MQTLLEDLNWRYATKKYDPTKKLSAEQLELIKTSLVLTPSAFGLQPFQFLWIQSSALREQLLPIAHNQHQVIDASEVLIICAHRSVSAEFLDAHADRMRDHRGLEEEKIAGFRQHIKRTMANMEAQHVSNWASRQAYIALGQLLQTCAQLRIDATPMEGFQPKALDELLGLEEKGLQSVLMVCLGYRAEDDHYQHLKKVRRDKNDLHLVL